MVSFFVNLFVAIASVKALADYAAQFAAGIMAWYANNAKEKQKEALSDALSASLSVENDDDAANASVLWKKALSMPRIIK